MECLPVISAKMMSCVREFGIVEDWIKLAVCLLALHSILAPSHMAQCEVIEKNI